MDKSKPLGKKIESISLILSHSNNSEKSLKVAIIYHYWAHYREPIARRLCLQKPPLPIFTLFSGREKNISIKTINEELSRLEPEQGGLRWHFFKNVWVFRHFLWQTGAIKLALSKDYDSIIFLGNMYFISTWISAILARISGKHVLMWTHGFLNEKRSPKEFIRFLFYKIANSLLVYGNKSKNILINWGFNSNDIFVVYNSLNYDQQKIIRNGYTNAPLSNLKSCLFTDHIAPILIFTGRLTKVKKLHMILEASKILADQDINVNVLFVGSGDEMPLLKQKSKNLGLENHVHFYGETYNEQEIGALYCMADLCVSPGEIGLTAMHSLAYGTPVVTHNLAEKQMPEFEAIIDNYNGFLFEFDNIYDLAFTIKRGLIKLANDSNISLNCIKTIEQHYNSDYQLRAINTSLTYDRSLGGNNVK